MRAYVIEAVPLDGVEHGAARRVPAQHVEVAAQHHGGGLAARAPHARQRAPLARRGRVAQQVARVAPRVRAAAHHVDQACNNDTTNHGLDYRGGQSWRRGTKCDWLWV